jgi:cytolysin-activating lysine-acyltransferase
MSASDQSSAPETEAAAKEGAASGFPIANRVAAIGHAIWLISRSPLQKHLTVTDIEWLLMPPIMRNQFQNCQDQDRSHCFASWTENIGHTDRTVLL